MLIAYHGNDAEKTAILGKLERHRIADEIVKGVYWENGKGCAVGCTIESGRHIEYEAKFGIPQVLARLEDRIFEVLPNGKAKAWPERFMGAINPGSNLTMVWPRLALWLITEELPQRAKRDQTKVALAEVGALYKEWCDTDKNPTRERWKVARKTARAAAAAAYADAAAVAAAYADAAAAAYADAAAAAAADADAAAYAAAYADAAADAAAYAAAYAVAAAYADADAAAYARDAYYVRLSDKLIELLEAA